MSAGLSVISSMATRTPLADCLALMAGRAPAQLESVGGVDAARRVAAGEAFDVVVLASDAIERLMAAGHLLAGTRVDLVRSEVAIAVPAAAPVPAVDTVAALQAAITAAPAVGYSTGPSGAAIRALIEQWALGPAVLDRLVQAPPGVPVAQLVAQGQVALGFQQLSELLGQPGIRILGPMPAGAEIVTIFSAAVAARSSRVEAARALIRGLTDGACAEVYRRHGMQPA